MTSPEGGASAVRLAPGGRGGLGRFSEALGSRRLWIGLLLFVSVAAGMWLSRLTERGIGVGSDSAVYFAGARNILDGRGFTWFGGDGLPRPINHYPPFYSIVLSTGLVLGLSPDNAARALNVLLVTANTFLVGAVAGLLAASGAAAVLGALLFAVSEETLNVHSWAMSDSLYLFLALLCVTAATWSLRHESSRLARAVMWGSAGLAFLTRYAGIALIAVPLAATWVGRKPKRARPRAVVAWLALALIPGLAWLVRNIVLTGSATNRRFGIFPLDATWWREVGETVAAWFLPGRMVLALERIHFPAVLAAAALLALVAAAAYLGRRTPGRRTVPGWAWLPLAAWMGSHLVLLAASTATGYPPPDIDTRMLAPVFAALIAGIAAGLGVAGRGDSRPLRIVLILAAVAFLAFKAYAGRDLIARLARDGQGYTSMMWSRSPTLQALRDLDPDLVYANDTGAVYYFTGDPAYQIPLRYDAVTGLERAGYRGEYCLMRTRLRETSGLLVLFGSVAPMRESGDLEDMLQGLEPVVQGSDGVIFQDGGGTLLGCDSAVRLERAPGLARRFRSQPEDE